MFLLFPFFHHTKVCGFPLAPVRSIVTIYISIHELNGAVIAVFDQ